VSIPSLPNVSLPNINPSDLPSSLSNFCATVSNLPGVPAITYVELATSGEASSAQTCVWKDSVSSSTTRSLNGLTLTPDYSQVAGTGPFTFTGGGKTVVVTVTKESDGHLYVTKVDLH
jgi:hypothetical protein